MFLDVFQVIQLPPLTELHREHTFAGILPVHFWSLDKRQMLEHGRELLLVTGLVAEVELIGQVGPYLPGQPL